MASLTEENNQPQITEESKRRIAIPEAPEPLKKHHLNKDLVS